MGLDFDLWKRISERVLGSFIFSPEEFFRVYVDQSITRLDFHPSYRTAFDFVERARISKASVSEEVVASALQVNVNDVVSWTQNFAWGEELHSLVDTLQNGFSRRIEAQEILNESLKELEKSPTVHQVVIDAADRLMMVGTGAAKMATSMGAIRAEIQTRDRDRPFHEALKTGIAPIDGMLNGGLRPDRVYVIAGEQKSRKTTVLLNIYLYAAIDFETWQPRDAACGLLCYENNRVTQYYKTLAMLVVKRMYWLGIQNKRYIDSDRQILLDINSDWLEAQYRTKKYMNNRKPPEWIKCVEDCVDLLDRTPIYFYDRTPQGGGLKGVSSIRKTMAVHKMINTGTNQLSVCGVDFIGLARDIGMDDHVAVDMSVEIALDSASSFDMSIFLISQVSRAGKGQDIKGSYVLSSKGSARPEELAHNYLVTEYDQAKAPDKLSVHQKLARVGNAANVFAEFKIHPPSGAFLL